MGGDSKAGRALRPRREAVDYTATAEASSTPRWMKQSAKGRAEDENAPESALNAEVSQPPRKRARKNARASDQAKDGDSAAEAPPPEPAQQDAPASPGKAKSGGSSGPAAAKKGGRKAGKKGGRKQEAVAKGSDQKEVTQTGSEGETAEQPRQSLGEAKAKRAAPAREAPAEAPVAEAEAQAGPSKPAAREPAAPDDENAPPAVSPPPAATSTTFKALQVEYAALLAKYQDIKAQRIVEVEEAIGQIRAQERAHTQKAVALASHWEAEAQRQAAVAASGEAAQLRRQLERVGAENAELKRQLLDSRTEELKKDETIIGLKRKLGELVVLAEAMEQLSPASARGDASSPSGSTQAPPTADPQPPQAPASQQPAAEGTVRVQEAAAVCPEGASASEGGMPPPPPQQPQGAAAGAPGGAVQCISSAKPLVPYRPGLSACQAAPKSRFAAEAAGALRGESEAAPAAQPPAATAAGLPRTPAVPGVPADGSQTAAPGTAAVGRQLSFTPKPAATPAVEAAIQTEPLPTQAGQPRASLAENGLQNLLGLALQEERPRGGFAYRHPPTGFVFEIVADDSDESDEEGGRLLVFNPLELGAAEQALPPYFKYEIKFAPAMKTRLVGRVLEYLDQATAA